MSRDDALAEAAMSGRVDDLPIDESTRLLCHHALRLNDDPGAITDGDLDGLRAAGFDDRALLDLTLVVGYFNFVNRIASGLLIELES